MTFKLFTNRVELTGKNSLGQEIDGQVALSDLRLPKTTIFARNDLRQAACALPWILVLTCLVAFGERIYGKSTALFLGFRAGLARRHFLGPA
jgi:hypothetical protein